jgi:FMN phosphatase YigB (HAD superfamily)
MTCYANRPKAVAFDIGNVLWHVDLGAFTRKLVTGGYVPHGDQGDFLEMTLGLLDVGLMTLRQALDYLAPGHYDGQSPLDEMEMAWLDTIQPALPMLELLQELLDKKWRVALLSNIGLDHAKYIERNYPVINRCDKHFSCYVGARKPNKIFYQSFNQNHPARPFFDDREENIRAAEGYLYGIRFALEDFPDDQTAANKLRELIGLEPT